MKGRSIRMANHYIQDLAQELTELTGQRIGSDHIHPSRYGRSQFIQPPKAGAPMLLHHYDGYFLVDMHPNDFNDISSGTVNPHDYITSANWLVGYYWGGMSMTLGSYYQPLDIVGKKENVQHYLNILSCRGKLVTSGYMPNDEACRNCSNVNCCSFRDLNLGNWEGEMPEPDLRVSLFDAIKKRFERKYPRFTLKGITSFPIPEGEIWLVPNPRISENSQYSFMVKAPDTLIQNLLMRENVPHSMTDFVETLTFKISHHLFSLQSQDITETALMEAFNQFQS